MVIMIEKIVITFLVLGVVPMLLGNRIMASVGADMSLKINYVFGWLSMLAVFEIVVVPATFLRRSLSEVCWIYSSILSGVIIVFVIFYLIEKKKNKCKHKKKKWRPVSISFYGVLATVLLVIQLSIALFGVHLDADDAYYVGTATTSLSTDTLFQIQPDTGYPYSIWPLRYIFSALMSFWSYLSKITGIHPLVITHSIIPIIFISMSYMLWWELGKYLFESQEKRHIFFLFLNIINIYGNTSVYTQSSFLLFRIWQGKALLPNIIFPAILVLFLNIYDNSEERKKWILVFITIIAACCCSSMAVPMGIIVVLVLSFILALVRKNWKVVVYGSICCIPCIIIGALYIVF